MDILAWIWWLIASALSALWGFFWFLIGGWVSTLLQIAIVVMAVFYAKYGWRRAPQEIWKRASAAGRFSMGWVRAKEFGSQGNTRVEEREVVRVVRVKEFGDMNVSTGLSLLMVVGVLVVGAM